MELRINECLHVLRPSWDRSRKEKDRKVKIESAVKNKVCRVFLVVGRIEVGEGVICPFISMDTWFHEPR